MNDIGPTPAIRERQLIIALTALRLTPQESAQLKAAANGALEGGEPLEGELRLKAAAAGVAFRCSGRLHPIVYRLYRT